MSLLRSLALSTLFITSAAAQAPAVTLQTISNPSGGHVVYGVFNQESSMQGAMVGMLRKIHEGFGSRPEVGQFFRSRQGQSVATFFTVKSKAYGDKPISGMVIVTMPQGMKPAAAALYDDAVRFKTTRPQLMKKLSEAMNAMPPGNTQAVSNNNSGGNISHGNGGNGGGPVPQLHPVSAPDNSASMRIAPGWRLTNGASGQLVVSGPNGESLAMTIVNNNIYDPNNPQARNMIQYAQRNTAPYSVCSPGRDLLILYQCVSSQQMRRMHRPPVNILKVYENKSLGATSNLPVNSHVVADLDLGDGKGPQHASIELGAASSGAGIYTLYVTQLNAPKAVAEQEWPTMLAMAKTYSRNEGVLSGQTNQALSQQNQWFDAQQSAHRAQVAQGDAQVRSYEAHNDAMDRQSKSFQNYMLDQSILQDGNQNTRSTEWNNTAQAYVDHDPNRYQIIDQKDWIKGVDY